MREESAAVEHLRGCDAGSCELRDSGLTILRPDEVREQAAQIVAGMRAFAIGTGSGKNPAERRDIFIIDRHRDPSAIGGAEAILQTIRRLGIAEARRLDACARGDEILAAQEARQLPLRYV